MKIKKLILILLIPFLFLFFQIATIKDYGISWDEPIHFTRGQSYLHIFLTGEKTYKNISGNRSYFQNDSLNGLYFLQNDSGHPPTNDILAALTNKIFYQRLNLLGDIDSYHLFNILCSTLLITVVVIFAYQKLGLFPSIFSGVIMASYPFLFAESHFNIKDPPQAAFFSFTIWLFYLSLKKFDWKLLFLSLLSCGLSLGMKFNILFLPFILLPYLFIRYKKKIPKVSKKYLIAMLLSPLIVFVVFVVFWPYLWQDLIGNLAGIFSYYKQIGTGASYQTSFLLPGGFNAYPLFWIITTTPPTILFFLIIGILSFFKKTFSSDKYEFLWLLWFSIPILRVSLPNSSIYGGARQIIEFLPGMILISSIGFRVFIDILKKLFNTKKEFSVYLVLLFIVIANTKVLIDYHPNQNVYFNFIIGGLNGAKEKNIPYWGNSFGNAYLQTIKWMNNNVEKNAKLALIQGTGTNIPKIKLRKDITFSNLN
ncbi:glycosyltransferase family 39 protein, partial [Patescibacteria group bacterium]